MDGGQLMGNLYNIVNCSKKIDNMRDIVETKFEHVPGHSGNLGNDMADKLANHGAAKKR